TEISVTVESLMNKDDISTLNYLYQSLKNTLLEKIDPTNAKAFFDKFESGNEKISEYKGKLDSLLETNKGNQAASTISDSIDKIVDGIGSVADVSLCLILVTVC
ncbi:UNVERIFIED_CONTAM: hypothetical protein HDU68_006000, partial [Siphonaria sp. JEL0065]